MNTTTGAALWALRVRKGRVDALEALPYHRANFIQQRAAGHELQATEYGTVLRRAMRPTIGRLRMVEAAIRCDVACRDAVAGMRQAVRS
jgi:hypothetical protein